MNRVVKHSGQIWRHDTQNRMLLFCQLLFYRGEGWTASVVEKVTISKFCPHLKLPPIILVDQPIGTTLFNPAIWFITHIQKISTPIDQWPQIDSTTFKKSSSHECSNVPREHCNNYNSISQLSPWGLAFGKRVERTFGCDECVSVERMSATWGRIYGTGLPQL